MPNQVVFSSAAATEPLGPPRCAVCRSTTKLLTCSACKVVHYCGAAHQVAHRKEHKRPCTAIKRRLEGVAEANEQMRAIEDEMIAGNIDIFDDEDDGLASYVHTARGAIDDANHALVVALLGVRIHTRSALELAHEHCMKTFYLGRAYDNTGLCITFAPATMLRLGEDQACYGFIKWLAMVDNGGSELHDRLNDPGLDDDGVLFSLYSGLRGADALEPCDVFVRGRSNIIGFSPPALVCDQREYVDLGRTVALTLVKIRLLFDLQSLHSIPRRGDSGNRLPQEIVDAVRLLAVGNILSARPEILGAGADELGALMARVRAQIVTLFEHVHKSNKHMWPALIRPGAHLAALPQSSNIDSVEQMRMVLSTAYQAWAETPGPISIIEALSSSKYEDTEKPSAKRTSNTLEAS